MLFFLLLNLIILKSGFSTIYLWCCRF